MTSTIAGRDVKPHVGDVPGGGDSEDLGVEVAVAHPRTVGPPGQARNQAAEAGLPTRIPENPEFSSSPTNIASRVGAASTSRLQISQIVSLRTS